MATGFALLGYLFVTATPSTLWRPEGAWWRSMAVWFAAAIVVHDFVLFPLYTLADRLLDVPDRRRLAVPVRNYLRVPALGSGLVLLIFLPDIIGHGAELYSEDTGLTQQPFLGRWLMISAAMFAISAASYASRRAVAHRHTETGRAEQP
jgi:Na+/melibiose symporter-like transporter